MAKAAFVAAFVPWFDTSIVRKKGLFTIGSGGLEPFVGSEAMWMSGQAKARSVLARRLFVSPNGGDSAMAPSGSTAADTVNDPSDVPGGVQNAAKFRDPCAGTFEGPLE